MGYGGQMSWKLTCVPGQWHIVKVWPFVHWVIVCVIVQSTISMLSILGACPQKFLKYRCSEIKSEGISPSKYHITSKCTCPIMQVCAYTCLPGLLHLLSLPSLLYLVFAQLVFCTYLVYFPMTIATYSLLCMSTF